MRGFPDCMLTASVCRAPERFLRRVRTPSKVLMSAEAACVAIVFDDPSISSRMEGRMSVEHRLKGRDTQPQIERSKLKERKRGMVCAHSPAFHIFTLATAVNLWNLAYDCSTRSKFEPVKQSQVLQYSSKVSEILDPSHNQLQITASRGKT